jgi:adenine deaminase
MNVSAHIIDVLNRRCYDGVIAVEDGRIVSIDCDAPVPQDAPYVMPGFVDAHVHIESSMLLPEEFGRVALKHGTVAAVCDPHEIANVLGTEGVEFMIENSRHSLMKMCFAAPSCVPSTGFETAGGELGVREIDDLVRRHDIYALGEMMNSVGVVMDDPVVMGKIDAAMRAGKPIDGHAPLLTGDALEKYVSAGITTDHECTSILEAEEKLALGMSILLRSGSAANDFVNLKGLLATHSKNIMFCADDKHPDDLLEGHINKMVSQAVACGYPIWNVLWAACVEPVKHYRLPVGLLQVGDPADFIVVDNVVDFNIMETYVNGVRCISSKDNCLGQVCLRKSKFETPNSSSWPNRFVRTTVSEKDILVKRAGERIRVIGATESSIITECRLAPPSLSEDGENMVQDVERDLLKIVMVNRYSNDTAPQVAFISGFGLRRGAIASTIAHDCHNLIAVGVDDCSITKAMNRLIQEKGGIAVCDGDNVDVLPLPVAGLMSPESAEKVAGAYVRLNHKTRELGCRLSSPFMTLSFMALPVIPHLKLTDKGLFDFSKFGFVEM